MGNKINKIYSFKSMCAVHFSFVTENIGLCPVRFDNTYRHGSKSFVPKINIVILFWEFGGRTWEVYKQKW